MGVQKLFGYEGKEVRIIVKDGEPWWVLKDVCDILDLSNTRMIADRIDSDDVSLAYVVDRMGMEQQTNIVNESGLYNVILRSDKPEARKFKKWITSEVLPSIRKHSAYLTPQKIEEALLNPDTIIRLATDLKAERERRIALEDKAKKDAPKLIFAEACMASGDTILVREAAKLLAKRGIEIGEKRLWKKMREWGMVMPRGTEPYQRFMTAGYFEIREGVTETPESSLVYRTTMLTQRGLAYVAQRLAKEYGTGELGVQEGCALQNCT